MLGIAVCLIISWILLHFIEHKNLSVLGIRPYQKRLKQCIVGFVFFFLLNLLLVYADLLIRSGSIRIKETIDMSSLMLSFWYHLKSALFEELVFRGALLYILIQRIGSSKALVLSALYFGVYHWFSYGIFGSSLILMLVVLIITGTMGYIWGYSFYKTKSMLLGFGMHLGWNFATTLINDGSPFGALIFEVSELKEISNQWLNLIYHLFKGILPAILAFYIIKRMVSDKNDLAH